MAQKIGRDGAVWKQTRKGWVNQSTGAVAAKSSDIPGKRKQHREYRNADATLLRAYLANRDIDALPVAVLMLYGAAVALTDDWSSTDSGKLEQLLWLSKTLPDYAPASIRKYCSCSGTESRRLSRALRSISAAIAPYAAEDFAWAYDVAFFNRVNAGSAYPWTDGILGGKETRLGFAVDLVQGALNGLSSLQEYPDGWCSGTDTRPTVRGERYSKWVESDEYADADYADSEDWKGILCNLQSESVGASLETVPDKPLYWRARLSGA